MKNVLQINRPENKSYIFWEHFKKSIMVFSITFITLFLLPALSRKTYWTMQQREAHYNRASEWMDYLAENPIIPIIICFLIVLTYNLLIMIKNRQNKYLASIAIDNNSVVIIGRTNMYFEQEEIISTPVKDLECIIYLKPTGVVKKQNSVKFIDKTNNNTIALLPLRHDLWIHQYSEIKETLLKLENLGVTHKEVSSGFSDSIWSNVVN